jgi:hypothetical protein
MEVLRKLSVQALADKLRLKWAGIKNWYTPVADRWGASGQMDPNVCITNFIFASGVGATLHPSVVQYLHLIVSKNLDMIDFTTKTLSFDVWKDSAPLGIDPSTGQRVAGGAPTDVAARLAAKRKSRATGKKRTQADFLESLESTIVDLSTAETDSDIRIADSIESLAKSAQLEALIHLGKNQEIMTSPQKKKFRDKMDNFLDTLDF